MELTQLDMEGLKTYGLLPDIVVLVCGVTSL